MRLPPPRVAWRMAACRRRGSAVSGGSSRSRVASVRAAQRENTSGAIVGAEGLGVFRTFGVGQQAHPQFGLFQRALAAAVQADAALVRGQRILKAHSALFHLLDQLLQL